MSKITKIDYKHHKDRYWVFVDGEYCCSIRSRTFKGMDLSIGQEITCNQIKEMENFHWKKSYGKSAWQKEKVRLDKVRNLIETMDSNILAKINALNPNPGAWFKFKNIRYKVWKAKINSEQGAPGITINDKLTVGCKDMSLQILEIQREGKNKLSTESFLIGSKFKKGERLY